MRLLSLLAPLLLVHETDALRVNGWYPCGATSRPEGFASLLFSGLEFECAKVRMPLCYDGICESSQTTEVFVKRKLADVRPATKSVWFLEGGPGASSTNMEIMMEIMASMLNHTVNLYTMDHRGTGRSGFLQCEAAQALAEGSPGGANLELGELADCVRDVMFEIDDHTNAYSVTSAARDVVTLLDYIQDVAEDPHEENNVFLYGVSYGTYLVERVMHLAPPQVKGYMVDGVLSEQGFSALEWNKNSMPPTKRFLEACYDSHKCPVHFKSRESVVEEVLAMYDEIDAAGEANACAEELAYRMETANASEALRFVFALLVRDPYWREVIPSLLKRVHRCSKDDAADLQLAYDAIEQLLTAQYGGGASSRPQVAPIRTPGSTTKPKYLDISPTSTMSNMLYDLITFSELWQLPMPDLESLADDYRNSPFGLELDTLPSYCVVSGGLIKNAEVSTCTQLYEAMVGDGVDMNAIPQIEKPFLYAHDQYWNTTPSLREGVGALFIVGGLDFQTPSELGRCEYEALDSDNKLLVQFDYGGHGSGFLPTSPDDTGTCGPSILASFIVHDGDVQQVDTSCVASLPGLKFDDQVFDKLVMEMQEQTMGSYDA